MWTNSRTLTWKWRMMVHTRPKMMEGLPSIISGMWMFTSLICNHTSQHKEWPHTVIFSAHNHQDIHGRWIKPLRNEWDSLISSLKRTVLSRCCFFPGRNLCLSPDSRSSTVGSAIEMPGSYFQENQKDPVPNSPTELTILWPLITSSNSSSRDPSLKSLNRSCTAHGGFLWWTVEICSSHYTATIMSLIELQYFQNLTHFATPDKCGKATLGRVQIHKWLMPPSEETRVAHFLYGVMERQS